MFARVFTIAGSQAAMAAAAVVVACAPAPAQAAPRSDPNTAYATVNIREGRSQDLCESDPARIFVRHPLGTACIAFVATRAQRNTSRAIFFIDGDVPLESLNDRHNLARSLTRTRLALERISERARVRIIRIARLGVDGSSGNHGQRHRPAEALAMNAAVDALKLRFGLKDVIVAGQSRGAMLGAALLTLGRDDVACAALGSGVYEHARFIHEAAVKSGRRIPLRAIESVVFDPSNRVDDIRRDTRRRVFIIGDPRDRRTPFDQQRRFAEQLAAAGHHVRLLPISAPDALHHGTTLYALTAAALCARDIADERIEDAILEVSAHVDGRARPSRRRPSLAPEAITPDDVPLPRRPSARIGAR